MKFDLEELRSNPSNNPVDSWRSPSPDKSLARTPQKANPPPMVGVYVSTWSHIHVDWPPTKTKEALQRMQEMRQLISKRQTEAPATPRSRPRSLVGESPMPGASETVNSAVLSRLEESLADADQHMGRAMSHHETLQTDFEQFMQDIKEVSKERQSFQSC
jgi:hypothetical protein